MTRHGPHAGILAPGMAMAAVITGAPQVREADRPLLLMDESLPGELESLEPLNLATVESWNLASIINIHQPCNLGNPGILEGLNFWILRT